jgi:hypothetical protein
MVAAESSTGLDQSPTDCEEDQSAMDLSQFSERSIAVFDRNAQKFACFRFVIANKILAIDLKVK